MRRRKREGARRAFRVDDRNEMGGWRPLLYHIPRTHSPRTCLAIGGRVCRRSYVPRALFPTKTSPRHTDSDGRRQPPRPGTQNPAGAPRASSPPPHPCTRGQPVPASRPGPGQAEAQQAGAPRGARSPEGADGGRQERAGRALRPAAGFRSGGRGLDPRCRA